MAAITEISSEFFDAERDGKLLVVVPAKDLRELDFEQVESGAVSILEIVDTGKADRVVVDFHRSDYFGSTAIGFFVKLWKHLQSRSGKLALCNLSSHQRAVLVATKLDSVWKVCSTRDEAIAAVMK